MKKETTHMKSLKGDLGSPKHVCFLRFWTPRCPLNLFTSLFNPQSCISARAIATETPQPWLQISEPIKRNWTQRETGGWIIPFLKGASIRPTTKATGNGVDPLPSYRRIRHRSHAAPLPHSAVPALALSSGGWLKCSCSCCRCMLVSAPR